MSFSEKSHVGMLHHVCPICRVTVNTDILLDRRLRNILERDNYDFSSEFCKECQEKIDAGYVALVAIQESYDDDDGSRTLSPNDVTTTGEIAFIRESAWLNIFDVPVPPKRIGFCSSELIARLNAMQVPAEE